jgi:hypothetical protein
LQRQLWPHGPAEKQTGSDELKRIVWLYVASRFRCGDRDALPQTAHEHPCAPVSLLDFNFKKSKFMRIDVDYVVVHPCLSGVGHAGGQRCVARTLRFHQAQRAARQRDDNVIEAMNMLARFCTWGEGPLGYDYAFILDLYDRNSFHVYNRLR